MISPRDMQDHITFCPQSNRIIDRGLAAELRTVRYLYDNLKVRLVGDYRILVNYNLPIRGADTREIDALVINKFGVFLLEVKGWLGKIDAYDDQWILTHEDKWMVSDTIIRENPVESISMKAKILHAYMFGQRGLLNSFRDVSVTGMVVLTQGVHRFTNHSSSDPRAVVGLDNQLIRSISSTDLLHRGPNSRMLTDEDIDNVYEVIHGRHLSRRDDIVENYHVLRPLRLGDLFEEYEAENMSVPAQHVRLKRYQLQRLTASPQIIEDDVVQFKRSIEAVSALGSHENILQTYNFYQDSKRPDVFYEIAELANGGRLDEIMARTYTTLSLDEQLDYLEPLCAALQRAHNYKDRNGQANPIFHRNICPETIFVTNDKVVKLADFDFAKFGPHTVTKRGFLEKPYTAPELLMNPSAASAASDIYALGVLWYFLACLPTYNPDARLTPEEAVVKIDELELPEAARLLMKSMVARVVKDRPQNIEDLAGALKQLRQQK
jgi:Protein kinase domain/Nuclease-related domain